MPLFGSSSSNSRSDKSGGKSSDSRSTRREKSSSSSKANGGKSSSSSKPVRKSSTTSSTRKPEKISRSSSKGDIRHDSSMLKSSNPEKNKTVVQRRVSEGAHRPSTYNAALDKTSATNGRPQARVENYPEVGTRHLNSDNNKNNSNNAQSNIIGGNNTSYNDTLNPGRDQYVQDTTRREAPGSIYNPEMNGPGGMIGYGSGGPGGQTGSAYGNQMGMGSMYGPGGLGGQTGSAYGNQMGMGSMYGSGGPGGQTGSAYGNQMGMGSIYGSGGPGGQTGSAYGNQMGMGSMYGSGGAGGQTGSAYGNQMGMGSMYGSGGPGGQTGSAYGNQMGMGSMYGPGGLGGQTGSAYGNQMGMGSMYGPGGPGGQTGSAYGNQMGMGSMYGPGGPGGQTGSAYGNQMGMGSIYGSGGPGGPTGSAYGNQMGMGSMYGPGGPGGPMGSAYGSQLGMGGPMPPMFGSQRGMDSAYKLTSQLGIVQRVPSRNVTSLSGKGGGINSMYGLGSIYGNGGTGISLIGLSNPWTPVSEDSRSRSGQETPSISPRNGGLQGENHIVTRSQTTSLSAKGAEKGTKTTERDFKAADKVKSVSKDHILALMAVSDKADSKVTLKESEKKVSVKGSDGKNVDYEADEVLRLSKVTTENSTLLKELLQQVEASHNVAVFLASAKTDQTACLGVAQTFLKSVMASLAKAEEKNGLKYEAHMTAVAMPSHDSARDLFAGAFARPKPLRFGSNPLYGVCLMNLEEKPVKGEMDAEKLLQDAMKRSTDTKETVLVHMVLKQIKKSTGDKVDVGLSAILMVFVRENGDYLAALSNKDEKVVPVPLFKDVIGGGSRSLVVTAISGSDAATEAKILGNAEKLRSVQNTAPRSGNVARFVEFTGEQEKKTAAAVESAKDSKEKAQHERILEKLRVMLTDGKELLAKPETTKPKVYAAVRVKDGKASGTP
ncbi:hypothetical protein LSM04_006342 [Trypanosoma melophagium]|uniref:uncharacterized protein n=1 Tax=Trypanosoma melophagium TaxID=715481 RepID=UPI00351A8853|nr:hypothetical protein LSM04_006342 [Trypanosoma melophagium]